MPAPPVLDARINTLKIVVWGLVAGLAVLTGAVVAAASQLDKPPVPHPVVAYAFLGFAGVMLLTNLSVVPLLFARRPRPASATDDELFNLYAGEVITRAALLEGPAVLLVVGYLVTGSVLVLAPVPLFVALLAAGIPTRPKFEAWLSGPR